MTAVVGSSLPMDLLLEIFIRSDLATLICCATTCKLWRRLITDPAFLRRLRALPPGRFVPSLLLGFFYQDSYSCYRHLPRPPQFVPTSRPSPSVGAAANTSLSLVSKTGLFNFYQPVASRDGLLVLRRLIPPQSTIKLCVCNPMTGEHSFLPLSPLLYSYAYALLTGYDLDRPSTRSKPSNSFQLLAVKALIHDGLRLQIFSSEAGAWGSVMDFFPGCRVLVHAPAVVHRGVVHWLCCDSFSGRFKCVFALRADTGEASMIQLPVQCRLSFSNGKKGLCLATTGDGRLCLLAVKALAISVWTNNNAASSTNWVLHETMDMRKMLEPQAPDWAFSQCVQIELEGFCARSGAVFLWVLGAGLFELDLETKAIHKASERRYVNYFCPYEMDWISCLSAMQTF